MANTYVDYTATAAQTDFAFNFNYLEDSHVVVEIDGVDKTLTTDYTIVTSPSKKVVLTSGATAGQLVRVKRVSDFGTDLVDFVNGSVLNEADLDKAYQHNRYLNEEAAEGNNDSMQTVGGGTDFNAESKKIVNLATPTLSTDATNKNYVDDRVALGSTNLNAFDKSTHTGDNSNTEFTLSFTSQSTTPEAYLVTIDGVVQTPTTAYSVNTTTNKIIFTSAPPTSASIVVVPIGTSSSANDATVTQAGTSTTKTLANWTNDLQSATATGSTTSRTLSNRFADVINVLDYGASTTASAADNTTAFSNAIASGRTVYIPAGTFNINYIDLSGINDFRLVGESQYTNLSFGTGTTNLDGDTCAIMINNGTGGSGGTHGTSSRRLRLDGFKIDANGLDIAIYIDFMTDSHLENIAIRDCVQGLKLNYSWMNMFTNFDVQGFTSTGFNIAGSNLNGNTFTNHRVSASTNGSKCYLVGGNSTKLISCDAEGSVTDFTGMDINYGRSVSIDGCHFEGGRGINYSTGDRTESLSIIGCFFDCDTYAIQDTDYAESLTIIGNTFKSANDSATLDTLNGTFLSNKFEGGATYSIGSNFKGVLHDGTRFMSEKRLERQYIRIPTFSTSSGSPTLLATFPEYSARTSGKIILEQRISTSDTSSQEINFAIAEDATFRQTTVASLGTALGITLSVVDNGSTRSIYGYGTYASNLAGFIDLVTY